MKSRCGNPTALRVSSLSLILACSLFLRAGGVLALGAGDVVRVRFGYFDNAEPLLAACGRGWLDLARNVQEDTPAYEVGCFPQSSGAIAASRMDNTDLDISRLGSSPWVAAIARGLDLKEIYLARYSASSTGIYVREDNPEKGYEGIQSPRDLINRTLATPYGSNSHYHLQFLIDDYGLTGMVSIVYLSLTEINEAWKDGTIDGAACWGPAKDFILSNEGRELVTAGVFSSWGAPVYSIVAARRAFANEHPQFVEHLVGILSRINDSFIDNFGRKDPRNADRWDAKQTNDVNYIGSMVDSLMRPGETPGDPSRELSIAEREELDQSIYHMASDQLTCKYLGIATGRCAKPTGQHLAATKVATFLLEQKAISNLGIMDPLLSKNANDNSCKTKSSFCGGDIIDPTYLANSRKVGNPIPLGPYEGKYAEDKNESGQDAVLAELEKLDTTSAWSPYAEYEVGRDSGHSNCTDRNRILGSLVQNGTFGDGASALPGRSYSDNQHCEWTIYPPDNGGIVEVSFQRLKLWSGDFVRIYSGGVQDCPGNTPRTLLAQLSGMYENDELPDALPPFRSSTCIVVEFDTDGKQERGYALNEAYGDGFEIFYTRYILPESNDCNGNDRDSNGLCLCNGTAWGGDCSHNSFCLGTSRIKIEEGKTYAIQSSLHATREALSSDDGDHSILHQDKAYPNDLDCTYELDLGETFDLAKVEIYYDLEDTFDLLRLRSGLHDNATYYVLSGHHISRPETFYVPVDENNGIASLHFTTDDKGRRRGFYAEISGFRSMESTRPTCEVGQFGSRCESDYCMQRQTIGKATEGISFAGRVVSQNPSSFIRAMPWAPDSGGCVWEIEPDKDSNGGIRLIFNKPFDIEPHLESGSGDRIIFESLGNSGATEVFMESCMNDDTCHSSWQTGKCTDGICAIRSHVELNDIGANVDKVLIQLVTDRNDGGESFTGVDFYVHQVQSCPTPENDCASVGGSCDENNLCTCSNNVACDCPCDKDTATASSKSVIALGVLSGVAILLVMCFLVYRNKQKEQIRTQRNMLEKQGEELKLKATELKLFKDGTSKFGDAVDFIDRLLLKSDGPLTDRSEVENLLLVKRCLIMGTDKSIHVPGNLSKSPGHRYIMKEFAGVSDSKISPAVSASVRNFKRIDSNGPRKEEAGTLECLPEFVSLDASQQMSLFELLSFSNLRRWDFNVFDVSAIDEENTLLLVAWAVIGSPYSQFAMAKHLEQTNLELSEFEGYKFADLDLEIRLRTLFNYLRLIQGDYKSNNPYHNAIHAADVVQSLHSLIQMAGEIFDKEEMFTILVASAVHDVKHPGMNNAFQVNTFSDLALTHNDAAVLENEHSSHAFKLMIEGLSGGKNDSHFLSHATPAKFAEIRKRIIAAVLHTDMSQHFSTVAKIKSQTAGKALSQIDSKLRWEILMYMLHLADISNPAKCSPMFELWTDRCLDEFFAQGDKERKLGLPISPNCDRNQTKKPDSQIGFINFVVKPAYLLLADIIPAVGENILPVIESNLVYWGERKGLEETV